MLELRAVLTDFAGYKEIPCAVVDSVIENTNDTNSGATASERYESRLDTEYNGRPTRISLFSSPKPSVLRIFGPTADLIITISLGSVSDIEEAKREIYEAHETFSDFFDMQDFGKIDIFEWKSEDQSSFVGLSMNAPSVDLTENHLQTLDFYLQWITVAGNVLFNPPFSEILKWENGKTVSYHEFVREAAKSYDRLFEIGSIQYLESELVPFDWSTSDASLDDRDGIPDDFARGEFLEKGVWGGKELLGAEEMRSRVFSEVAKALDSAGSRYTSDESVLWIIEGEIVTAEAVFMSIDSGLSGGSRGWFRVPDGAREFTD